MVINTDTSKHYFRINNTILWDCRRLVKEINRSSSLLIDSMDRSPIQIDDNIINLNKIKIDIQSTIYKEAVSADIINSWYSFSKYFPIEKFLEIFMFEYVSKLVKKGVADFEPDIIELLRLAYWFDKCLILENFEYKINEVRYKLGKRLLKNFEKYNISRSIDDYTFNNELNTLILKQKRQVFTDKEKKQFANYLKNWFKESFSFISEFMSAFLSSKCEFQVSCDKKNNFDVKHDYDFIIENFGVQVKTNIMYRKHSEVNEKLSNIGLEKERIHVKRMNAISTKHKEKGLSLDDIYSEVMDSIRTNTTELLKAVNQQRAKIIVYNGTQSIGGYALALYDLELDLKLSFEDSIKKALKKLKSLEEKISLVFFSFGNYIEYHIAALCFEIPCINNNFKIDKSSLEKIRLS